MPYNDKEKAKESSKKYYSQPEVKEKVKVYHEKYYVRPEIIERERKREAEYRSRPDVKERQRKWRLEHKESIREKNKDYRNNPVNKARKKERDSRPDVISKRDAYRSKPENKIKMKSYSKKPESREKRSKFLLHWKLDVFTHYSKKVSDSDVPVCACCGYDDLRFLSLDHIYTRKHVSEKEKRLGGRMLWKYVKENGFPSMYQVMCYNCNIAKGTSQYCPHQLDRMKK